MGSPFDFFGKKSWPANTEISPQARANRALLSSIMQENGFKPLKEEWWHFTLIDEPYPDTYFNFPVQRSCAQPSAHIRPSRYDIITSLTGPVTKARDLDRHLCCAVRN
jgi:hypothetical protein